MFRVRAARGCARLVWRRWPLAVVLDPELAGKLGYFVWGGAPVLGGTREAGSLVVRGFVGAGADGRYRESERHTFNASLAALGAYALGEQASQAPTTWTTQLSL